MMRYTYLSVVALALLLGLSACDVLDLGSIGTPADDSSPPSPSTAARQVEFEGERYGCAYGASWC